MSAESINCRFSLSIERNQANPLFCSDSDEESSRLCQNIIRRKESILRFLHGVLSGAKLPDQRHGIKRQHRHLPNRRRLGVACRRRGGVRNMLKLLAMVRVVKRGYKSGQYKDLATLYFLSR